VDVNQTRIVRRAARFLAASLLVTASACGEATVPPFSCTVFVGPPNSSASTPFLCFEMSGGTAQDQETDRQSCTAQKGQFSMELCTRVDAAGACREGGGSATLTTWYYQNGLDLNDQVQQIQDICKQTHATFVSP
jgi:hypothetical protein